MNAALTGMVPTKADNPAVPVTPGEIAADAERVGAAGAAIVHLHARRALEDEERQLHDDEDTEGRGDHQDTRPAARP